MASSESLDDDYESDISNESTLSEGALNKSRKLSQKFVSEPNLSALDSNDETPKNTKKRSRLFRSKVVTQQNKKYQKRSNVRSTPTSCVSCVDPDTDSELTPETTPKKNILHSNDIELKINYLTSTPGVSETFSGECSSPYSVNFRRASMSPITQSTQKLSKAMQVCALHVMSMIICFLNTSSYSRLANIILIWVHIFHIVC